MLQVQGLSTLYGPRQVLKDVDFNLPAGQVMALIGPNGAGKTTLIRAISGVIPLQRGTIRVNGVDLPQLAPSQRARTIAVVPQNLHLPPAFTAREVILLGRTPHLNWLGQFSARDEDIAADAMRRTHTLELAERRLGELSGGEQQRIMLARALAQACPILLLDEPTAHLDLQYQVSLLDHIRRLAHQENLAVLIAMHDLNLVARYADHIALLVDGAILAQGTPHEVLTSTRLSQVYHVPLQVFTTPQHHAPIIIPVNGKEDR